MFNNGLNKVDHYKEFIIIQNSFLPLNSIKMAAEKINSKIKTLILFIDYKKSSKIQSCLNRKYLIKIVLYESFNEYVNDSDNDMSTPQGAVQLIREDSNFRDFTDTLTEGLEGDARDAVTKVLEQQRMSLLSESANVGPSVFTH